MEKINAIISLDLGTNSVHGVLAKINEEEKLEILSADTFSSDGVRNGVISDIRAAKFTISKFFEKAERDFNVNAVDDIVAAIRGSLIDVVVANTRLKISSGEENGAVTEKITEETIYDIKKRLSETNKIDDTKEIIEIIPQQYAIDEQVVVNPEQMFGKYLELTALMICGTKSNVANIKQAIDIYGDYLKYGYVSVAETLISNDDKDLGCISVDIGGMTTGIVVYSEGKIKNSFELPFGADYITRDISAKLKITKKEATELKEKNGVILDELVGEDINTEVEYNTPSNKKQKIQLKELISVIKPQVDLQLTEMSKEFIKRGINPSEYIGGFILTGGGSLLKGMPETFSKFFNGALAKIANFTEDDFICREDNVINSQIYTTALAILKNSCKNNFSTNVGSKKTTFSGKMVEGIKSVFKFLK